MCNYVFVILLYIENNERKMCPCSAQTRSQDSVNTLISGVDSERWRSRVEAQHVSTHDHVDCVPHSQHSDLEFCLGLYIWALLSGYCCSMLG